MQTDFLHVTLYSSAKKSEMLLYEIQIWKLQKDTLTDYVKYASIKVDDALNFARRIL